LSQLSVPVLLLLNVILSESPDFNSAISDFVPKKVVTVKSPESAADAEKTPANDIVTAKAIVNNFFIIFPPDFMYK